MEAGSIGNHGLCYAFMMHGLDYIEFKNLFRPEYGYLKTHWLYFGSDNPSHERKGKFTTLRQNMVLLMAAMNNEL